MNLIDVKKDVKWTWDPASKHCTNNGTIELSTDNLTITKKGPDGIGVVFGTHQFESDREYHWEIKIEDEPTYFKCFGICDKNTCNVTNF